MFGAGGSSASGGIGVYFADGRGSRLGWRQLQPRIAEPRTRQPWLIWTGCGPVATTAVVGTQLMQRRPESAWRSVQDCQGDTRVHRPILPGHEGWAALWAHELGSGTGGGSASVQITIRHGRSNKTPGLLSPVMSRCSITQCAFLITRCELSERVAVYIALKSSAGSLNWSPWTLLVKTWAIFYSIFEPPARPYFHQHIHQTPPLVHKIILSLCDKQHMYPLYLLEVWKPHRDQICSLSCNWTWNVLNVGNFDIFSARRHPPTFYFIF